MIVFVDSENRIKAVGESTDTTLRALEINDDANPFNGWSVSKICCYKVSVSDGFVTMMTPYVDSRLLDTVDLLGKGTDINAEGINSNDDAICEIAEYIDDLIHRVEKLEEA